MMSDHQQQMEKLKPGQMSAACEACHVWLTSQGVDSGAMSAAIKEHKKVHESEAVHPIKGDGESQVSFPISVIFKASARLSGHALH
jgi:aerobic-type carbon monoxide dehydrogenase small subunit (CoxS/CutS family)